MLRKKLFLVYVSLSCVISGYHCATISSCTFAKTSSCDKGGGMVARKDTYTITSILDNSGGGGSNSVELQTRRKNAQTFNTECLIFLNTCSNTVNRHCDCVDNMNGNISTYFTRTAFIEDDNLEVRTIWGTETCDAFAEMIEDVNSTAACAPDFIDGNANANSCSFEFSKTNPEKYCCSSALSPVETRISFNGQDYRGGSCISLNGSVGPDEIEYTFTSTVCGVTVHSSSCNGTAGTTTTATPTVSNSTGSLDSATTETSTISTTPVSPTTEKVVSDGDCDTTCIIIIVVVLVVVVCGAGIAVGVIYYWKKHGKIATCVIIVEVSATLIKVETLVIQEVERKEKKLPDCEKVIKYKGKKQDDKTIKLKSLVGEHEEVTVKVTVNVCRDGTFVLDEIVSVAVLEITVKTSESLGQLKDKVKTDVSKEHSNTKLDTLIFLLDGKTLMDMTITLGVLFTGLEDGMMLTVIVHLDGSRKCEIKGPEPTGSSSDSKLIKRPISPPSLRYNEENKHTSEVEKPYEDEPRKKKKKRRGKTSRQGVDNGNDYTDAPNGTFENVHNDLDHGDNQHESDGIPRRLPPLSENNQSKDGNRTMQTSGLTIQQSPQKSRPTSIEMTSAPRPLPRPLPTKKK